MEEGREGETEGSGREWEESIGLGGGTEEEEGEKEGRGKEWEVSLGRERRKIT